MIGREDEIRRYRERTGLFTYLIAVLLLIVASRLVYLQVMRGEELRKYSEANRLKKEKLFSSRGIIFDRNGEVVVDNRASFDVVLYSQYYPFKDKKIDGRLAEALGIELEELKRRIAKVRKRPSFHPVLLKSDVDKNVVAAVEMDTEGFPGVDIEASVRRRYPFKMLAAQLLGYVGEVNQREIARAKNRALEAGDYVGKSGLEKTYDATLRGQNGVGYVEVDARGRRRKRETQELFGYVVQTEPVGGNNLYLTIDVELQQLGAKLMTEKGYRGAVVAIDPQSGEVLAMVSVPSYSPESISGREVSAKTWKALRENKFRPLRNRVIQDFYAPGSTFKPFVSMVGLAEGKSARDSEVTCPGYFKLGRAKFHCWKRHGKVDFLKAIKESCDIFFYKLGLEIGIDTMAKFAREFGFGRRTGIALRNEQRGIFPDEAWKKERFNEPWQGGETVIAAIGQGYVTATPIQIATAYAAIANGGFVYRPYVVKRIEGQGGEIFKQFSPKLNRRVELPSEIFELVKDGLSHVVNQKGGTAYWSRSRMVEISGKTGTSQVKRFKSILAIKCEDLEYKDRHHGWFAGYAPREKPEIVVAVIGEHTCHGATMAPIVRSVIEKYLKKKRGQEGTREITQAGSPVGGSP